MKLRAPNGRETSYLDYDASARGVAVEVTLSLALATVDQLYFVREPRLRLLWNYVREVGVRTVVAKILSRSAERARNRKHVIAGIGRVAQSHDPELPLGCWVVFVAPRHPAHVDRVVLAPELIQRFNGTPLVLPPDRIACAEYGVWIGRHCTEE